MKRLANLFLCKKNLGCFVLTFVLVTGPGLFAQNIWLDETEGRSVAVEFLKPNFNDSFDYSTFSSGIFFSGRLPMSDEKVFVAEVPIGHGSVSFQGLTETETVLGNPYFGVEFHNSGPITTEVGLRIPVTADSKVLAASVGSSSDFDRIEAFLPDVLATIIRIDFQKVSDSNVATRFQLGPTLWILTEDTGGDNVEVLFDYNGQVGYKNEMVSLMLGPTGRVLVTEGGSFSDRSFHHFGGNLTLHVGRVSPGLHVRVPLDSDLSDQFDYVLGLNFGFNFD